MGIIFFKRVEPFFSAGGGIIITESFEYEGNWNGTIQGGDSYPNTFAGFNTPSASLSETFEYEGNWSGTIQGGDSYSNTFTGFDSSTDTILESFETSGGW